MTDTRELPDATVADAPAGNWADRFAPARWRPYLRLSRADRPVGTWLLLIPCLWAIALAAAADPAGPGMTDLWLVASSAVGAFLMRGAGCTWNDLTDRDIDAAVARTRSRPLPSGQVTARQALVWAIVQSLLAACILFTYNATAILLGVASLADLARLSPRLKLGSDIEFLSRPEWKGVDAAYGFSFGRETSYQPTFMYRALGSGDVDVISAFSSDGRIAADDLVRELPRPTKPAGL